MRDVLALHERVVGAEHADTLNTCQALALCLAAQHKTPEALLYAQRALAAYQKTLGKNHRDTKTMQLLVKQFQG